MESPIEIESLYLYSVIKKQPFHRYFLDKYGEKSTKALFQLYAAELFGKSSRQSGKIFDRINNIIESYDIPIDAMNPTVMLNAGVIKNEVAAFVACQIGDNLAHVAMDAENNFVLYTAFAHPCPKEAESQSSLPFHKIVDEICRGKNKVCDRSVAENNTPEEKIRYEEKVRYAYPHIYPKESFEELLFLGEKLTDANNIILRKPITLKRLKKSMHARCVPQR